jgi:hypothetical protein
MEPFATEDRRENAKARIAARLEQESRVLPYRWGYFQGAILIPWTLLLTLASLGELFRLHEEPWYISTLTLVMGLMGFPLAYGLLWKKFLAFPFLYATVGLALLLVAVKLPVAIVHYRESGYNGSAISEAEILLVWVASLPYYRNRQAQFH